MYTHIVAVLKEQLRYDDYYEGAGEGAGARYGRRKTQDFSHTKFCFKGECLGIKNESQH